MYDYLAWQYQYNDIMSTTCRSAATIRTAALMGVNSLFISKSLSPTQVDQVLENLLPQVHVVVEGGRDGIGLLLV